MDRTTQLALLDRIMAHRQAGAGTDTAPASMRVPVADYASVARLAAERRLLRTVPTLAALSGLVPDTGSYATVDLGDASVIVTRAGDGEVRAMLNVCRHRGAQVASGCGRAARLVCPYHGWTYHLDGRSASRRRGEYFDDLPCEDLVRLPVLEQDGLIWVSGDPQGSIGDRPLHGAEAELGPLDLARYRLFAATAFTRRFNWKLAVDTFCEAYHVPALHRDTLRPMIHGDYALFNAFGPHGRMVATRRSIVELDLRDRSDWSLLPHATILWFLVPNTVLIYQQDHVQLYQSRPGATVDEAHLSVALYVPRASTRSDEHWQRNFDLLVEVTDREDFATVAGVQRGFAAAAQDHLVFGRNEPGLQHFHAALQGLLGAY
ncbi:MAG: aromatic ring-hydroxylating dioxygenase subunit alpha [Pseudomonadales bacterium]